MNTENTVPAAPRDERAIAAAVASGRAVDAWGLRNLRRSEHPVVFGLLAAHVHQQYVKFLNGRRATFEREHGRPLDLATIATAQREQLRSMALQTVLGLSEAQIHALATVTTAESALLVFDEALQTCFKLAGAAWLPIEQWGRRQLARARATDRLLASDAAAGSADVVGELIALGYRLADELAPLVRPVAAELALETACRRCGGSLVDEPARAEFLGVPNLPLTLCPDCLTLALLRMPDDGLVVRPSQLLWRLGLGGQAIAPPIERRTVQIGSGATAFEALPSVSLYISGALAGQFPAAFANVGRAAIRAARTRGEAAERDQRERVAEVTDFLCAPQERELIGWRYDLPRVVAELAHGLIARRLATQPVQPGSAAPDWLRALPAIRAEFETELGLEPMAAQPPPPRGASAPPQPAHPDQPLAVPPVVAHRTSRATYVVVGSICLVVLFAIIAAVSGGGDTNGANPTAGTLRYKTPTARTTSGFSFPTATTVSYYFPPTATRRVSAYVPPTPTRYIAPTRTPTPRPTATQRPTATPRPTQTPRPTATPRATQAPAPVLVNGEPVEGDTIYESSLASWRDGDLDNGKGFSTNGAFHLRAFPQQARGIVFTAPGVVVSDHSATVDVRLIDGSDLGVACLIFRQSSDDTARYDLCLDSNNDVYASVQQSSTFRTLANDSLPADRSAAGWNTLKIAGAGNRLWFYVNGILIGQVTDSGSRLGDVGIGVFNNDDSRDTEFEFTNLVVKKLSTTANAQPTVTPKPAATATPVAAGVPRDGQTLIQTSLTNWRDEEQELGYLRVQGGTYHIGVVGGGDHTMASWTERADLADISASVEVRHVLGNDASTGCVAVRYDRDLGEYQFCVWQNGETWATYDFVDDDGVWQQVMLMGRAHRAGVNSATQWNTLKIVVRGDEFWFIANGVLLGTATNDSRSAGAVDIHVSNPGDTTAEYEFRNLVVRSVE